MSAQLFMRAIPPVIICSTGFGRARTPCTRSAIEAAELGDIRGKRVLHLQCHIGRDTLCLVRRGATVTGLDFSSAALDVARRLSDETGLKANFVEGTVDRAPELTPGPFDLVFTTWGT